MKSIRRKISFRGYITSFLEIQHFLVCRWINAFLHIFQFFPLHIYCAYFPLCIYFWLSTSISLEALTSMPWVTKMPIFTTVKQILALLFDCHISWISWNFLPSLFVYLIILVFVASVIQPIKFMLRRTTVKEESVILMSPYYCLHSCTVSGISGKFQNLKVKRMYSC